MAEYTSEVDSHKQTWQGTGADALKVRKLKVRSKKYARFGPFHKIMTASFEYVPHPLWS